MRTVWRIVTARFAETAFSGEGARLFGGRWNRKGEAVIYTAESRSLALLEMLVQDEPLRARYILIPAHLPDEMQMESLPVDRLPADWQALTAKEALRSLGSEWIRRGTSCVLHVPSAVVPAEANYLLNPRHPEFPRIQIGQPEYMDTDLRLLHGNRIQKG